MHKHSFHDFRINKKHILIVIGSTGYKSESLCDGALADRLSILFINNLVSVRYLKQI